MAHRVRPAAKGVAKPRRKAPRHRPTHELASPKRGVTERCSQHSTHTNRRGAPSPRSDTWAAISTFLAQHTHRLGMPFVTHLMSKWMGAGTF